MTNAFGVVLDSVSMQWATVEGVAETVIAAIYRSSLSSNPVSLSRSSSSSGVVQAAIRPERWTPSSRRHTPSPAPVASISTSRVASGRTAARIKPGDEHMRRAHLARLRVHATHSAPEGSAPKLIDDATDPIAFEAGRGPKMCKSGISAAGSSSVPTPGGE
jgi:hypothetical protein